MFLSPNSLADSSTGNSLSVPQQGEFERPISLHLCMIPIIEQQNDMLFVLFQETIGVVQITITDAIGANVFTETVDMRMTG